MTDPVDLSRLAAAIQRLRDAGVSRAIVPALRTTGRSAAASLYKAALSEVPAYSASRNPDLFPELEQLLIAHFDQISELLSGQSPRELGFVADYARRRAEQKFPLDAELATCRYLHKATADWLRDTALKSADETAQVRRIVAAIADFSNEYVSAIATLLTSEYVTHTRVLAEAEGDRRTELFKLLLEGYDESDRRAAELLRRDGYLEQRQSFCVVVARSIDAKEMENAARAQRMAVAIGDAVRKLPVRLLTGIPDNVVTLIVSGTQRLSGWTAPQSLLADRLIEPLRTIGPVALIGVSSDAPSTSHIPAALREAKLALDFASVGSRVVPFAHLPFRDLLVRVASDEIQSALPAWVDALLEADKKSRGALLQTLRAYADANMNTLKAAAALGRHPNTLYARMQKVTDVTGLDPLTFNGLSELLLAVDCA